VAKLCPITFTQNLEHDKFSTCHNTAHPNPLGSKRKTNIYKYILFKIILLGPHKFKQLLLQLVTCRVLYGRNVKCKLILTTIFSLLLITRSASSYGKRYAKFYSLALLTNELLSKTLGNIASHHSLATYRTKLGCLSHSSLFPLRFVQVPTSMYMSNSHSS